MALMVNRDAPYSGLSSLMAMQGRYGDTELVHMSKPEIQGLASLGQLTINPDTGLPEAFKLGNILPMVANVGLAIATGGMSLPAQMAIMGAANFGMGLIQGQSAGQALLGGITAAAGTGIMGGLSSLMSGAGTAAATGVANAGTAAAGAGAAGAAGSAATEAALQSSLSTFGTGVGGNVGPALTVQGLPLAGLAAAPPPAMMFDPNLNTPAMQTLGGDFAGVDFVSSPQPTMMFDPNLNTPAMQTLGGDFTGVDFGSSAISQPTMPSAAELEGYRAGLGDFAPRQDTILEQVTEGVSDVGEGISNIYKDYLSPSRQSIQPTQAEITKAYEARAAELQIPVERLSEQARSDVLKSLQPSLLKQYGPLGAVGIGGLALTDAFGKEVPEQQQMAKIEEDTGFNKYTLKGGEVIRPVATEKELTEMALKGGRRNYFTPYRYAAEGGLIGLQQGGMATPQAPSAMAGMLAQPQTQQPLPINVQVQPQQPVMPQQPQPSMPMPPQQMGSGVTPLPDQQKEFMKLMDMEDQVQSQKRSQSTQALANLMGLGMNFAGSQYPQTSPSGQAVQPPPTPPMNYGSQVNMGLATGGQPYFEGQVQGPGDGQSDEVAFRVDGGQIDGAMLSPQEYVLAADVVSAIGNGSSDAGAAKLDQFMKGVRQNAYGTTKQMQPFNNQGLTNLVA